MPPSVQKGFSATILSFIGSSFILGIVGFYFKDTMVRINHTIDRVNSRDVQMVKLESTMQNLNNKLTTLDRSIDKTTGVLESYIRVHGQNLSNMTVSMTRVTQKLVNIEDRCHRDEKNIDKCMRKLDRLDGTQK